jgi:hypothetical protein
LERRFEGDGELEDAGWDFGAAEVAEGFFELLEMGDEIGAGELGAVVVD